MDRLHTRVGAMVLRSWGFAPQLVAAVEEHHQLQRNPYGEIDYADVVIVANALHHLQRGAPAGAESAHAFRKIGKTPRQLLEDAALEAQTSLAMERLHV